MDNHNNNNIIIITTVHQSYSQQYTSLTHNSKIEFCVSRTFIENRVPPVHGIGLGVNLQVECSAQEYKFW